MKIMELKNALDPVLALKSTTYHPLILKLLSFYQSVASGVAANDTNAELTPEQFFELANIVFDIKEIINQRSPRADKNLHMLIEQTQDLFLLSAMRYVLCCENEWLALRAKGMLTLEVYTYITRLILSPQALAIVHRCHMPNTMMNVLFLLAKQKLLSNERMNKIHDFANDRNSSIDLVLVNGLKQFLQRLYDLNVAVTQSDLDFLLSGKSSVFLQSWHSYPDKQRLDKLLLNHASAIVTHADPVKALTSAYRIYRITIDEKYNFSPALQQQLAKQVLSIREPWSALNVFIEMLEQPALFTQENRAIIIATPYLDLQAIDMALEKLNKDKLLNQFTFDAICSHAKPLQLALAFSFLRNNDMDKPKNQLRAVRHSCPLEFVLALKILSTNNLNKRVYRVALNKSPCPDKLVHALCFLLAKIELTAAEVTTLAKNPDPYLAATWLLKLQADKILTPEKKQQLLASSNPKLLANKFLCENYETNKTTLFSSDSVLFKQKKGKQKVEQPAETFVFKGN